MNVIAVVNPKGGTSKTTTTAYLAHTLADSGRRVLVVDADGENESLLRWSDLAGDKWRVDVIALPSASLHNRLPGLTRGRFDDIVIDTPPMDIAGGVITSALHAATHVVIPCAPTTIDVDGSAQCTTCSRMSSPLETRAPS
ncbi:AAA family ATPase [Gordonia liuliyuniae]|uniref:AAA family ATPase n=1 Tax=Gordonia liuliyuniae TaxID=2911517 RepID=UPI00355648B6